jgi:hypothetical protein
VRNRRIGESHISPHAAATERVGPNHYGAEPGESGQEKGERIVAEELKREGCSPETFSPETFSVVPAKCRS